MFCKIWVVLILLSYLLLTKYLSWVYILHIGTNFVKVENYEIFCVGIYSILWICEQIANCFVFLWLYVLNTYWLILIFEILWLMLWRVWISGIKIFHIPGIHFYYIPWVPPSYLFQYVLLYLWSFHQIWTHLIHFGCMTSQ